MRVLALDAATERCSVALFSGDGTRHAAAGLIGRHEERGKSHAQQILDMVRAVLAEAEWPLSRLDGIAASVGPGAFTGVRISVAVAQGLAFGAGLRVIPVTTLEALSFKGLQTGARRVLACLDARMGEVYWGCFAGDPARGVSAEGPAAVGPPLSVRLPTADEYQGIGRGFSAYPLLAELPDLRLEEEARRALPDAREMSQLGALRFGLGEGIDPADLTPIYLRNKVAMTSVERDEQKAR